jgi:hypothetical protein
MWLPSIIGFGRSASGRTRHARTPAKLRRSLRLNLEQLEDRALLSSYSAASVSDLIADINAANKAGGTNTITLTAPTGNPYVLTAVDNTTNGPTGLPVIAKKDILTVVGNGDTITSSGAGRLFDVASGSSLTLQNLTLQDGFVSGSGSSAAGGGIYNQGTLVLSAVIVQGCGARGSSPQGGGIYNQGTLVLSAAMVQGCVAIGSDGVHRNNGLGTPGDPAAGGGIWSKGSLTIENGSLVQNNRAIGGDGGEGPGGVGGAGSGGGIYVAGGTANLAGVTVSNNIAHGGRGSGFFTNPPCPCFSDNFGGNAFGGGLDVEGGTVSLSNDVVENNSATAGLDENVSFIEPQALGGGLYLAGGTVTLCSDTVRSNSTFVSSATNPNDASGGGIYIVSGATVYIDSFTVANTINNSAFFVPNIDGPYTLQNC